MDEWTAEPINWMSLPVDVVGLMLAAMNVKQTSMCVNILSQLLKVYFRTTVDLIEIFRFLCASKTFQSLYGYRFLKELGFPIDFMNKRNLPLRPEIAGYGTVCGRIATSRPRLRRLRVTDHPATKYPLFGTMLKTLASISSSLSIADLYSGFFDSFVDSFDAVHLEALYIVLGSYHSILRFLTRPLPKLRVLSIRNLDTARGLPLLNIAATTTKSLQLIYLEFKDRVNDSAAITALTQANLDTLRRVILRLETDSAQRNIRVIKPTDCTHNWAGFDATCQNLYGVRPSCASNLLTAMMFRSGIMPLNISSHSRTKSLPLSSLRARLSSNGATPRTYRRLLNATVPLFVRIG
jgi:hypothetical protein